MISKGDHNKAVVHVSGTLLRRNWYGQELTDCIIVRPAGEQRDSEGWVVHQVRFDGPSELVFSAKPREAEEGKGKLHPVDQGFVGTLPGFDNAIMVYIQADESVVHVQPHKGKDFIPLKVFKERSRDLEVDLINPMLEINC